MKQMSFDITVCSLSKDLKEKWFMNFDIDGLNKLPILEVAKSLGLVVNRAKKSLCFLHMEKTPSLSFNVNTNMWKCFGCGEGGNVLTLVEKYRKCSFQEACQWLQYYFKIIIDNYIPSNKHKYKKIINNVIMIGDIEINNWIINNFIITRNGKEYLLGRKISEELINKYNIRSIDNVKDFYEILQKKFEEQRLIAAGFLTEDDYGNCVPVLYKPGIIFPYYNFIGELQTLQLRKYEVDKNKYLFLKGISKCLFNESLLSTLDDGSNVFLTEGAPDALSLLKKGINAVGLAGITSFSDIKYELFSKLTCNIIFDNDKNGINAASKLKSEFDKRFINCNIIQIQEYKDINEMLIKQER